jgi:CRP-like cAMP-binding protein
VKFRNKCVDIIQESLLTPGQTIADTNSNILYFVEFGEVEFFLDRVKRNQTVEKVSLCSLHRGEYFGEYSFFTGQNENF